MSAIVFMLTFIGLGILVICKLLLEILQEFRFLRGETANNPDYMAQMIAKLANMGKNKHATRIYDRSGQWLDARTGNTGGD